MNLISLLSSIVLISNVITTEDVIYSESVKTPYNTQVGHRIITDDFSSREKSIHNRLWSEMFPLATLVKTTDRRYNCHSYAFYSRNPLNVYIPDPSTYWLDGSYAETQTPVVGDILVYFNFEDTPIHSAIIESIVGSGNSDIYDTLDNFICLSKWGSYPVFRHSAEYCPYVYPYAQTTEDEATSVKVYHHNHAQFYENFNEYQHKIFWCCNYDEPYFENHDWHLIRINGGQYELQYRTEYECSICHARVPLLPESI